MTQSVAWILIETLYHLLLSVDFAAAGVSCLSNPCMNGICIDDLNSNYSCYCIDGYTGVQCQTNWDECWSAPCKNGGSCIDGIASYNCSCTEGFVGENCETNYNECASNPCYNNATCVDLTNGYACACLPGYRGAHCELDVAVCNTTEDVRCLNGGRCLEGPGFKYSCDCLPGWTGGKCEESVDECASSPCQNGGGCIDGHADYMCACTFGHTGKSCEVLIEFCTDNSCSNHALCVVEDHARVCYCVPDYHGERCQYQYDECQLGPRCLNGGTCIDGVDNFTCSCPPKLTGILCECLQLDDGNLDCEYISPTPLPGGSNISNITTEENLSTTFYDFTTTYQPTTNRTTDFKSTTFEITTDFTTIREIFTKITDVIETSTQRYTDTAIEYTTATTPFYPNETSTEIDQTTALTELITYIGVTVQTDNSITEIVTDCGEACTLTAYSTLKPISDHTETSESSTFTVTTVTEVTTTDTSSTEKLNNNSIEITTSDLSLTTTTERLFTDSPTGVDTATTWQEAVTTEQTTLYDNLTLDYSTVLPECSDSLCNKRGSCVQTPHGFRCVCNFNYGGEFCEDRVSVTSAAFAGHSYITHKLHNESSIHVALTARTLITEGQIMYMDIAQGIYLQLYFNMGLLKFKFSCGYQTMLLGELKTFLNNGFDIKIETLLDLDTKHQHCNATLRLNDTVAMSGGQVANLSALGSNYTLYLGNSPSGRSYNDPDVKPFVGCMQNLMVNGEARRIYDDAYEATEVKECSSLSCLSGPCHNGGSCVDSGARYTCACANGFSGDQCEKSVCERNPCQHGGACARHPASGFLCLCPFGRHGMLCEYSLDITRPYLSPIVGGVSSFVMYPLTQSVNSDRFDLKFRFHTADMEQISVLAFIGQNGKHDSRSQHLAVTFVKGYIMLTWNMGNGARRIFTPRPLSERRAGGAGAGHAVRVGRRGRSAWLSVDSRFNVSGNAPGAATTMDLIPQLFIGGHPSLGLRDLPHDLPLHAGWAGCVWEVSAGGQAVRAAWGRGAGQCGVTQCHARACSAPNGVCVHHPATYGCVCNEGWYGATCAAKRNPCDSEHSKCRGFCVVTLGGESQCDCPYGKIGKHCQEELTPTDVLFTGIRSYLKLHPRPMSSVSLAIEAEIKPARARGLLLYAKTSSFHVALSLQGGILEYRWTDKTSGVVSLVRSGVVASMEQWHSVKAGRYGSRLYVWIDGAISTQNMAAHTYPHTTDNTTVTLGGEIDLATLPFDVMAGPPESYTGCIRNLHLNNILLPLEQQNIQEGVNLADCDGTACGGETCGGGVCRVEAGRAQCACGGGAAGARCRRHAPCNAAVCKPPGGLCRRGACVCAAGFAGFNCTQKIEIRTPQFSGDSLMIIQGDSADPAKERIREEVEDSTSRFERISLNFTTAERDGLLLWMLIGSGYLGVGLENGFLKIVTSHRRGGQATYDLVNDDSVTTEESSHRLVSGVSRAGMLADGEWHALAVRVRGDRVAFSVDGEVAYHEERIWDAFVVDKVTVYIGGVPTDELRALALDAFRANFRGCVDHISTRERETGRVHNYTDFYSENVKSCQLFP